MSVIEVAISRGTQPGSYDVEVVNSPVGEGSATITVDPEALLQHRSSWQQSLLASAARTRRLAPAVVERPLREVGEELFAALFSSPAVGGRYRASLAVAQERGESLRVVLRLNAPELAPLPWEAMYDAESGSFLSRREALVRHVPVASGPSPLTVTHPLRILAIASAPKGLPLLDVEREIGYLTEALHEPIARGALEVHWVREATWEAIHTLLLSEPWHIIHFVGHGDFDVERGEGVLALETPDGWVDRVEASRFADLLGEAEPTPRLVVLNACSSAESDADDVFSGTAAALVRSGINAVTAMQFAITDTAAIAFARGFYTAIASGRAVDDAVRSGRVAILGTNGSTFEWVTPVLYLRGREPHLFTIEPTPKTPVERDVTATPAESEDRLAAGGSRPSSQPSRGAAAAADTKAAVDSAPEVLAGARAAAETGSDVVPPAESDGPVAREGGERPPEGRDVPATEQPGGTGRPDDSKRGLRNRSLLVLVALLIGLGVLALALWQRAPSTEATTDGQPGGSTSVASPGSSGTALQAPLLAWQSVPGSPVVSYAGVTAHRGELWVVGGASGASISSSVHVYSPTTGAWRPGPALPEPRSHAALVSNGKQLFLIGGISGEIRGLRTVFRLDAGATAWVEETPLPAGRFSGAAAWDGGRIVFGGGVELRTPRLAASEIWTLRDGRWVQIGKLTSPREQLGAASDGAGTVWFLGGANVNGGRGSLSASVESIQESAVRAAGSLPVPVQGLAALWTREHGVCAFGGSTRQPNDKAQPVATTSCVGGPVNAARWPDLPQVRNGSRAVVLGDTAYVVGGTAAADSVLSIRYR